MAKNTGRGSTWGGMEWVPRGTSYHLKVRIAELEEKNRVANERLSRHADTINSLLSERNQLWQQLDAVTELANKWRNYAEWSMGGYEGTMGPHRPMLHWDAAADALYEALGSNKRTVFPEEPIAPTYQDVCKHYYQQMDRTLCGACGAMHFYCDDCGILTDDCDGES